MDRSYLVLLGICWGILAGGLDSSAQGQERRNRSRPILRLKSDVPTAPIRQLVFSESGGELRLYAAGLDKQVRRWTLRTEAGHLHPEGSETFDWPIYHGSRGTIYGLAVHSSLDGDLLAFGGHGYRPPQVVLLNEFRPHEPDVLVDSRFDGRFLGRQSVLQLAFGENARWLVVGESAKPGARTADVVVWDLTEAAALRTPRRLETAAQIVRAVAVNPIGTHLVTLGSADKGSVVETWHLQTGRRLGSLQVRSLWSDSARSVDWLDDQTWVVGTIAGVVDGSTLVPESESFNSPPFLSYRERPAASPTAVEIANRTGTPFSYQVWNRTQWGRTETLPHGAEARVATTETAVRPVIQGIPEAEWPVWRIVQGKRCEIGWDVRALAAIPGTNQVVAAVVAVANGSSAVRVQVQSVDGQVTVPLAKATFASSQNDIVAVAASPDGRYVAAGGIGTSGGHAVHQIRIWAIDRVRNRSSLVAEIPQDAGIAEPPSVGGPIAAVGIDRAGRDLLFTAGVAVGAHSRLEHQFRPDVRGAGIQNAPRAASTWHTSQEWLKPVPVGPLPLRVAPGLSVPGIQYKFQKQDGSFLNSGDSSFVFPAGNAPQTAVLFRYKQGDGHATGIAVGLVDGIQVWGRRNGSLTALRSFYGHSAPVTCLGVAPDGSWMVSGAQDGTISAWSLQGLGGGSELGVTLDRAGAVVANIADLTPGWEAGFEMGQRIEKVLVAGGEVGRPHWKTAIETAFPGQELYVKVAGVREPLITPVSWDPLYTFYPRHDGGWTLWTPQGHFDDSEQQLGDGRLEWVVNLADNEVQAGDGAGVFTMPVSDFDGLRSEEDVNDVFKTITARLAPAQDDVPQPPDMRLTLDAAGRQVRLVTVLADWRAGKEKLVERSIWLNGKRLKIETAPVDSARGLAAGFAPSDLRSGRNSIVALAAVQQGERVAHFRRVLNFSHSAAVPGTPRLHYLGVGVTKLQQGGLTPLKHANQDVIAVGKALDSLLDMRPGRVAAGAVSLAGFRRGEFRTLAVDGDAEPTTSRIVAAFEDLAERGAVGPDDFAVVMLAGHGEISSTSGEFHFVAQDGVVPQRTLMDLLGRLPCRALLILDTCHSEGAAGIEAQLQDIARVMAGPQILTSCGRGQQAYDTARLGHGMFTIALLEALTDRRISEGRKPRPRLDANGDSWVSIDEICRYVQNRTPDIVYEQTGRRLDQNPQLVFSASFTDAHRYLVAASAAAE